MDKIYPEEHIQAIANAIRRKNGKSVNYLTSEMAGAIDQLVSYPEPTGTQTITENGIVDVKDKAYADVNVAGSTAVLISKTITANGEYDAEDDEADGYSDVTVNVPNSYSASDEGKVVSSGALVAQTSTTKTANGTYDTTENNEVVVAVENSYVAADEGKVVNNGALVAQTSTTIIQNGTVDTTLNNEVVVNVAGARIYTDGTEQISSQITDVSNFTKLCDTSVKFGNYGNKVITRLGITDESAHSTLMAGGWNASGACYYDSENQIGAYGGYDFDAGKHLNKAKFWIGRYSRQNQTLIATVQYKNASDEWVDITDLEVTTTLPYPTNIFEVTLDSSLTMYGLRWIHKKTPQKTSSNNLTFFGMTLYEAYSIGTYSPTTRGLVRVPDNYDGFGALNTTGVPNGYIPADEGKVVSNGALVAQGSQTITQNGTYDTTLISELIANVSVGDILTGGEAILEAMRNTLQAYSQGYSAISSVFLSKDSGDRFTCNDRYFERTTNGNVLVLYGDASEDGVSGYFGYNLYTDDISKCVGIYSEYGSLRDPQTLTTPRGNTYYRLAMGSPWGGSAGTYNVKVSNGGSDIVTLVNNNLFTNSSYYSAKMDFVGAVVDAVFFASEQDDPVVLPTGYTRVKWIQGDGNAYINTGITPDADTIAIWRGIQVRKSSGDSAEFGSRIAYQNEMYALISNSTSNQYNSNIDFGTQRTQDSAHFVNNGPNEVVYNSPQGSANANDSAVVSGAVFNGNSYPIYLFTLNNGGDAFGAKSISKVCRFIIEDSNGTVADFIPCIRDNDNAVGMLDVISQTFFGNAGTGSFSAGDIYYPW